MRHTVLQRIFYENIVNVSSSIPKETQNVRCERSVRCVVMVNCCFYKQSPQIYYKEEVLFIVKESITCNYPCRVKD
jgi:hypothetical protein